MGDDKGSVEMPARGAKAPPSCAARTGGKEASRTSVLGQKGTINARRRQPRA